MTELEKASSGVKELISRLRDEGVQAGQQKADEMVKEAQERAAQIVAEAQTEADDLRTKARAEIETERTAAQEALKVAARDTMLSLASEVQAAFEAHVRRLVSMELKDKDFLQRVILAVAGVATADKVCEGQPAELLLPEDLWVTDEEGTRLSEEGEERFRHFVIGVSEEMLREGVMLKPYKGIHAGFRVKLVGEDLEIDLSDKALSDLLLKHMTPKFKSIFEGVE